MVNNFSFLFSMFNIRFSFILIIIVVHTDTGYTERYMDLPEENKDGYTNGSVLSYINQFPDE